MKRVWSLTINSADQWRHEMLISSSSSESDSSVEEMCMAEEEHGEWWRSKLVWPTSSAMMTSWWRSSMYLSWMWSSCLSPGDAGWCSIPSGWGSGEGGSSAVSLRSGLGLSLLGRVSSRDPPEDSSSRSLLLRHFMRRFWNQIFTC